MPSGGLRPSVQAVLDNFKNNKRDPKQAYDTIKQLEDEDIHSIVEALAQLSDVLCKNTYFTKAYQILEHAIKDIRGNPVLHELIAHVAFIMEKFDKSIYHNREAKKL